MKYLTLLVALFTLTCCQNSEQQRELIPEPDKAEHLKYEEMQKLKDSVCVFDNPDTSVSGIKIRDAKSSIAVIGKKSWPGVKGEYHFYSAKDEETLTLIQFPGDGENQISFFKIEYSDKADYGYTQLPINNFETEKGIRLGMNKKQIIEKLGTCYAALDSIKGYIELHYVLELPNDSKNGLLNTHNIPAYYASYKLWNDRLERFEFGFVYP